MIATKSSGYGEFPEQMDKHIRCYWLGVGHEIVGGVTDFEQTALVQFADDSFCVDVLDIAPGGAATHRSRHHVPMRAAAILMMPHDRQLAADWLQRAE